jgi:hypothetical protein
MNHGQNYNSVCSAAAYPGAGRLAESIIPDESRSKLQFGSFGSGAAESKSRGSNDPFARKSIETSIRFVRQRRDGVAGASGQQVIDQEKNRSNLQFGSFGSGARRPGAVVGPRAGRGQITLPKNPRALGSVILIIGIGCPDVLPIRTTTLRTGGGGGLVLNSAESQP